MYSHRLITAYVPFKWRTHFSPSQTRAVLSQDALITVPNFPAASEHTKKDQSIKQSSMNKTVSELAFKCPTLKRKKTTSRTPRNLPIKSDI